MSLIDSLFTSDHPLARRLGARMEEVEDALRESVRVGDLVADSATSHLAAAGGKRLRPALTLLTAELGPNPGAQAVIDSAVVVELTHLASLYHDDVMDDAPLRRGVPSAQYLYGNSSAIMAGDMLFARASAIVAGLGPRAVLLHARTFERLCIGQLHETVGPQEGEDPKAHHIDVLAGKTGSLIAASARYGVLSAGGSEELAEAVAQYGERVGVAFQIADDVIDLMSDSKVTGKTPGTDLLEGVPTMPTLLLEEKRAAGTLDESGEAILAMLAQGHLDEGDRLATVVGMLRKHDVVEETRQLAHQWTSDALAQLAIVPDGDVKEALEAFAHAMVDRMA
ncbi:heptaprenyl diphosphate synthase [Arcanobacterium wilhelmae]|uniref:Heptaprenyl diphosphate synthase n=1 Tax=Arcanobacterium wilhelmae TaxID=1803177 RepID=A0ABT9NA19_9ACTO|nr:polyprenyl synthetase family protein [Arcanobacterium wilhelmae]MDP9800544.1 heptaprenyl diphosphate synthase [Arcanobacterium wilhelmae]WFN89961.1 polyprenyl synthetase family protein [Arcanobacterium wilhelmae]